jgi:nucleotide-binding universal stress UspA family protein
MQVPLALVHAQQPISAAAMATAAGGVAAIPMGAPEETRDTGWDLLDALDRITPKRARLRLRSGQPAQCLQEYAHGHDAPLVVIGAPDHGALASVLLHSTAWELARIATVPVMYVPERFAPSW